MSSSGDQAYRYLREAIVEGRLLAGTRLREVDIARRTKASRTPVREALQRLLAEGLVERGAAGLVVRKVSDEEILKIYELRVPLERLAAQLAAQHITQLQLAQMRALQRQMTAAAGAPRPDVRTLAALNVEFHAIISRATHNGYLAEFIARLYDAVRRFGHTTFSYAGRVEEALREHDGLVDALATRNAEQAAQVAEAHIRRAMEIRLAMYAEQDDRPGDPARPVTVGH